MGIRAEKARTIKNGDLLFGGAAVAGVVLTVLPLILMFFALIAGSWAAIAELGAGFLFNGVWDASAGEFGTAGALFGLFVTTIIALIIAVPLSLAIALFVVEFAPSFIARTVGDAIDFFAAIPGVVFGLWGLWVLAPLLGENLPASLQGDAGYLSPLFGQRAGIGLATAGVLLAIMILPFMSGLMSEALRGVPSAIREAAYSLGATSFEAAKSALIRRGAKGLAAACFLGLSRAAGETVAVAFVIGGAGGGIGSIFSTGVTPASAIALELGAAKSSLHVSALIYLALLLFAISLAVRAAAKFTVDRFNKAA